MKKITIKTKSELNKNHHSNFDFKNYQQYIKNIAYAFSKKTNIDIDEFISEAGLIWCKAMQNHNPEKCSFIAYFKTMYRQGCLTLIKKEYTDKRGKLSTDSIDKPISNENDNTLHSFISAAKNAKITTNDLVLLSDSAKTVLKMLSEYKEPVDIHNDKRKKLIAKNNTLIKKTIGVTKFNYAIKEICKLFPNAEPAKQLNTFPIILTK